MWSKVTQPSVTENQNVIKWNLRPLYQREWGRQEDKHNLRICEEKVKEVTSMCNIPLNVYAIALSLKELQFWKEAGKPLSTSFNRSFSFFHDPFSPKETEGNSNQQGRVNQSSANWPQTSWNHASSFQVKANPADFVSALSRFHSWHSPFI